MYTSISLDHKGTISFLTLNRPDKRNALNDVMMEEMIQAVDEAEECGSRALVLTGAGSAFCAGADLEWMGRMQHADYEENRADSERLARLFRRLRMAKPVTVAAVNGPAIGGAVGIVAACDIALCTADAVFSFGEVRIGIVPAVIGPYIVEKTGASFARYYMLTGFRFSGERARQIGLVHGVADDQSALKNEVDHVLTALKSGGRNAQCHIKELLDRIGGPPSDEMEQYTVDLIAKARVSPEGQEGIRAFFEKRKPAWSEDVDESI